MLQLLRFRLDDDNELSSTLVRNGTEALERYNASFRNFLSLTDVSLYHTFLLQARESHGLSRSMEDPERPEKNCVSLNTREPEKEPIV